MDEEERLLTELVRLIEKDEREEEEKDEPHSFIVGSCEPYDMVACDPERMDCKDAREQIQNSKRNLIEVLEGDYIVPCVPASIVPPEVKDDDEEKMAELLLALHKVIPRLSETASMMQNMSCELRRSPKQCGTRECMWNPNAPKGSRCRPSTSKDIVEMGNAIRNLETTEARMKGCDDADHQTGVYEEFEKLWDRQFGAFNEMRLAFMKRAYDFEKMVEEYELRCDDACKDPVCVKKGGMCLLGRGLTGKDSNGDYVDVYLHIQDPEEEDYTTFVAFKEAKVFEKVTACSLRHYGVPEARMLEYVEPSLGTPTPMATPLRALREHVEAKMGILDKRKTYENLLKNFNAQVAFKDISAESRDEMRQRIEDWLTFPSVQLEDFLRIPAEDVRKLKANQWTGASQFERQRVELMTHGEFHSKYHPLWRHEKLLERINRTKEKAVQVQQYIEAERKRIMETERADFDACPNIDLTGLRRRR